MGGQHAPESGNYILDRGVSIRRNDSREIAFSGPDEGGVSIVRNVQNLSHIKYDDVYLSSREELHEFIKLHDLGRFDMIIIDHADCVGESPEEL